MRNTFSWRVPYDPDHVQNNHSLVQMFRLIRRSIDAAHKSLEILLGSTRICAETAGYSFSPASLNWLPGLTSQCFSCPDLTLETSWICAKIAGYLFIFPRLATWRSFNMNWLPRLNCFFYPRPLTLETSWICAETTGDRSISIIWQRAGDLYRTPGLRLTRKKEA